MKKELSKKIEECGAEELSVIRKRWDNTKFNDGIKDEYRDELSMSYEIMARYLNENAETAVKAYNPEIGLNLPLHVAPFAIVRKMFVVYKNMENMLAKPDIMFSMIKDVCMDNDLVKQAKELGITDGGAYMCDKCSKLDGGHFDDITEENNEK